MVFNTEGLVKAHVVPMNVSETTSEDSIESEYLSTDLTPSVIANVADSSHSLEPIYIFEGYERTIIPFWATGGNKNELK